MLMKDAARECVCKECGMRMNMFVDSHGKLIFFPENTIRPAYGFYELADHLRHYHKELYGLIVMAEKKKSAVLNQYEISAVKDGCKAWSM